MAGNTLSFLSGFGQSFGDAFFKKKLQSHQEELQNQRMQFGVLSNAFQSAAEQGDNESAATTLRMMAPLVGKDKKSQETFLKFADTIQAGKTVEGSQVSNEAQKAKQTENQAISNNTSPETLQTLERPRIATEKTFTKKGYFTSPIEKEVEKQKALIPIKKEIEENEQKLLGERQEHLARVNAEERRKLNTEKEAALISRDENKLARAYESTINPQTGLKYTPEEALTTARTLITQKKIADVENINARIEYRQKQFNEIHEKNQQLYKHYDDLKEYYDNITDVKRQELGIRGEQLKQQYGEYRSIRNEIESNEEQNRGILSQENQIRSSLSNSLLDASQKPQLENQLRELENQYDLRLNKVRQLQDRLYNLPKPEILIPSQQNNQPKRNFTSKSKNNDPLGIRN